MMNRFAEVAKEDRAMSWLLQFAEKIAEHMRGLSVKYNPETYPYAGPKPPEGVTFKRLPNDTVQVAKIEYDAGRIKLYRPHGKIRTINPRILRSNGETLPLKVAYPHYETHVNNQHLWIGDYYWEIEVDTDKETQQALKDAFKLVERRWARALQRSAMSDKELQMHVKEANDFVIKSAS
jgi:hypothetical protein